MNTDNRRTWIAVGGVVAAVIALNLVLGAIDRATRGPSGPTSSSYATQPRGLAAYADLLRRFGHPIVRVRVRLREAELDPRSTVVVLDPRSLSGEDAAALRRFAEAGGRVVAGGSSSSKSWTGALIDSDSPDLDEGGPRGSRPFVPVPEVAGVRTVRSAGEGSWAETEAALPVLGEGSATVLAVAAVGRGRVSLLADASPLQNRLLGRADNAALGLALAGAPGRPVAFVESVHGYVRETGVAAIPTRWLWALGGLVLAALVFMVARGRRLGPAQPAGRELPPARRAFVESLAAVVARSRRPAEAIEPVQAAVRERLARRLGVDPDGDGLGQAARALGLEEAELRRALARPRSERDVVAAGRALARLGDGAGP